MAWYNFNIPRIHIESTRSAHKDTLVYSTSLKSTNVNGSLHQDYGTQAGKYGDYGAKFEMHPNLHYSNVWVDDPTPRHPDGGAAYWVYMLVNAGHVDSGYIDVLSKGVNAIGNALISKGISSLSLESIPIVAAALGIEEIVSLLTADCDGTVVADSFSWTAANLRSMSPEYGKVWEVVRGYPGTGSTAGCGDNSKYDVAYDVTLVTAPATQPKHASEKELTI